MFSDEAIAWSADDKNKVHVGTLAVGRHFSTTNIFATNDQPNYPDHDFPYTNAKLVQAGFLILKSKERRPQSLSSPKRNMQVDSKRKHRSSSAPPNEFSSRPNFRGEIFVDALGRERIR